MPRSITGLIIAVVLTGCASGQPRSSRPSDDDLAISLAASLAAACPAADPADVAAKEACADRLTRLAVLRDRTRATLLWGAQAAGAGYTLAASKTTEFNPLVFRRMYLATFMFTGERQVETDGHRVVLRVGVRFRNALDAGAYPYPFWHSEEKWRSYERAQELLFFIQGGEVVAVLRSAEQDAARPHSERVWDGVWQWHGERGEEPHVALYSYLLSPNNPHVADLDRAYRALELAQRQASCASCHSPENPSKISPLYMFSYPNQALSLRHQVVQELEQNTMPPAAGSAAPGIADDDYRQRLLALARTFADVGDKALRFEGEPTP